jgi:outer membrane protein OmpA-like peptidoglycan-associated protein
LGAVGYKFHNNLRLELEGGFRDNDLDTRNGVAVTQGNLEEYTGFANVLYELSNSDTRFRFAIGAGIGVDNARFTDNVGLESRDQVLAWQGIGQLSYELSRHWDLTLSYRYLSTDDPEFATVVGRILIEDKAELDKHLVTIGIRYGFDEPAAPPPPPPPPPPPAGPKTFIIFFGFNKCNITAEADAVLSEAAAAAKSGGSASVRIVGHTDTVGSNSYNQKLSECRANAAKSNLVGKGVSEGSISTSGKGESELMVQTGDSVKEPQNRRATVDLN